VATIIDVAPGEEDEFVIDIANRESRVLLTEDRDFGQLVYAAGARRTPE
jgi:predicted nuclease of predicted toxin-antitoxin system